MYGLKTINTMNITEIKNKRLNKGKDKPETMFQAILNKEGINCTDIAYHSGILEKKTGEQVRIGVDKVSNFAKGEKDMHKTTIDRILQTLNDITAPTVYTYDDVMKPFKF